MTTIEALQKVYVTYGGKIEDVENITIIPDMINAINSVITAEHGTPITSDDVDEIINGLR